MSKPDNIIIQLIDSTLYGLKEYLFEYDDKIIEEYVKFYYGRYNIGGDLIVIPTEYIKLICFRDLQCNSRVVYNLLEERIAEVLKEMSHINAPDADLCRKYWKEKGERESYVFSDYKQEKKKKDCFHCTYFLSPFILSSTILCFFSLGFPFILSDITRFCAFITSGLIAWFAVKTTMPTPKKLLLLIPALLFSIIFNPVHEFRLTGELGFYRYSFGFAFFFICYLAFSSGFCKNWEKPDRPMI